MISIENVKSVMCSLSIKENAKDYWTSKILSEEISNGYNFSVKIDDDYTDRIKLEFYSNFDNNRRSYYLNIDTYKYELRKIKLERLCTT